MKRFWEGCALVALTLVAACDSTTEPQGPEPVATVSLEPATYDLPVGQLEQFRAIVRSADNRVLSGRVVNWSVQHGSIASVTPSGMVEAMAVGTTTVRATSEGKTGTATLRVLAVTEPVASITVNPVGLTMVEGTTRRFEAELRSSSGGVITGRAVAWQTDRDDVALVSSSGVVTAVAEGVARITASSEGKAGWTDITVTAEIGTGGGVVVRVELNAAPGDLAEGETTTLTARAYDGANLEILGRAVHWMSDRPDVATVSVGNVSALRPGLVTITARVDGASATAQLRVTASYDHDLLYDGWRGVPGVAPELYILDLRDSVAAPLLTFPAGRQARDPTPSPDGTRIAFVVATAAGSQIWVANRDGSAAQEITNGSGFNDQPAWSPDGSRIAYRAWPSGGGSDIWTIDAADGSGATNLTDDLGATNQAYPAWSPDLGAGSRIAFSHSAAGQGHIYTMNEDGSDKLAVTTPTASYDDQPAWSPNGLSIAFIRASPGIGSDLWVTSPSGAAKLLVQLSGSQHAPAWSPDGRPIIAFVSRHDGQDTFDLYTVWGDGTRVARRTYDATDAHNVSWIIR